MKPYQILITIILFFLLIFVFNNLEELKGKSCLQITNSTGSYKICFESKEEAINYSKSVFENNTLVYNLPNQFTNIKFINDTNTT